MREAGAPGGGALVLRGVSKRYGETRAVAGIDLEVEPGEFFSLLGPSGCGKTTTLRIVGGFEQPDAGMVLLRGVDVTSTPPHRRAVNTVFQTYVLFPHLTVDENIAYGLRRRRVGAVEIRRAVGEMLEVVRLDGFGSRRPDELSGGQQQRVALARALVNRPDVLLLDEPLGALDLKLRREMQGELKRIQNELRSTFLYVTHDQDEALAMSDRIGVMRDGGLEQVGAPRSVYEAPLTAFVATFLGTANLLEGRVRESGGGWTSVSVDGGRIVSVRASVPAATAKLTIGVRPEKIRMDEDDAADATQNSLEAVLESTSFSGSGYECVLRTPGGTVLTVYRQNLGRLPPPPGSRVRLAWAPEHTFVIGAGS